MSEPEPVPVSVRLVMLLYVATRASFRCVLGGLALAARARSARLAGCYKAGWWSARCARADHVVERQAAAAFALAGIDIADGLAVGLDELEQTVGVGLEVLLGGSLQPVGELERQFL